MHFQTSLVYAQRFVVTSGVVKHLSQPFGDINRIRVKVPREFAFPHCFFEPPHRHQ